MIPAPHKFLAVCLSVFTLSLCGCGDDDSVADVGLADSGAIDSGASDVGTDAGVTDAGDVTDATMDAPDTGPANGSMCTGDDQCASAHCFMVPLFGNQCGECSEDSHCDEGGCTAHNPFDTAGSVCNSGMAGDGCESSDACAGELECGTVIDVLGLVTIDTCGECLTDEDCSNGAAPSCIAVVDTTTFSGQRFCLTNRSLAQNDYCELNGEGNAHCASGHCGPVDVMGLAEVGACGECGTDEDCSDGETCVDGTSDFAGDGTLTGATCQAG